jgi:hypothetical protein
MLPAYDIRSIARPHGLFTNTVPVDAYPRRRTVRKRPMWSSGWSMRQRASSGRRCDPAQNFISPRAMPYKTYSEI